MVEVVLVDENGAQLGLMERLAAHKRPGKLHKAISVVLYRTKPGTRSPSPDSGQAKEILLQKRGETKPLWPGYWANTVCTHPLPGEENLDGAVRRLKEEMGIAMKKENLRELLTFTYQADYNQELSEHELDTVVVGKFAGNVEPNPDEVSEVRWMEWDDLQRDLVEHEGVYVPWIKEIVNGGKFSELFINKL